MTTPTLRQFKDKPDATLPTAASRTKQFRIETGRTVTFRNGGAFVLVSAVAEQQLMKFIGFSLRKDGF